MKNKKPKKGKEKYWESPAYTVMGFNCNTKDERLKLDAGNGKKYEFGGDTNNLCDRCFADIRKYGVYWLLYTQKIDREKKRIKVIGSAVFRKFCGNCAPHRSLECAPHRNLVKMPWFECIVCGADISRAENNLEFVVEHRETKGTNATVIDNSSKGHMCVKCAKKLSKKKNSLLRIFAKIAPLYPQFIDYSAPNIDATHGIYSMAEGLNERNKLLKSMSKTAAKVAGKIRKKRGH